MTLGRVMGLDYGTRRIGVAISDALQLTAQPFAVLDADSHRLGGELLDLVEDNGIELIVVGLPVAMSGRETESTKGARKLAARVRGDHRPTDRAGRRTFHNEDGRANVDRCQRQPAAAQRGRRQGGGGGHAAALSGRPLMVGEPQEPRRDGLRRLGGLALLLVILGGAYFGARELADWVGGLGGISDVTAPPGLEPGLPVSVEIPAGSAARQIGVLLAEAGVVESAGQFELAVRTTETAERLQAGRYDLETGMANDIVIDLLFRGPIIETFRVTVREGLWMSEILDEIARQTDFETAQIEQALSEVDSALLPGPASDPLSWEGLLFPDTYDFPLDAGPRDILQRLADTMQQRVDAIDWSELESRGLTVYDGIIIASLIEAEAGVDADRPLIASVVVNRLDAPMVLGIDATVIYAIGERGKSLTVSDLDIDSPYNTRKFAGLPPTPIGGPGRASLQAAASPAETDYLYYVLTSATGEHSFTASYDEFLAFKRQAVNDGLIP